MNERDYAPVGDCICTVCQWARMRREREQRQWEDLEQNYARYLDGKLVSSEAKE